MIEGRHDIVPLGYGKGTIHIGGNTTQQSWLLDKGFSYVTNDNVLIKES